MPLRKVKAPERAVTKQLSESDRGYDDGANRRPPNPKTSEYLEYYRMGREASRIGESRLGRGKNYWKE